MSNKTAYIFYFEDNSWLTFDLTPQELNEVKLVFASDKTHIVLDDTIIAKSNVRYVTKHIIDEQAPAAEVPEHMEQEVYEYIKQLERSLRNGETE